MPASPICARILEPGDETEVFATSVYHKKGTENTWLASTINVVSNTDGGRTFTTFQIDHADEAELIMWTALSNGHPTRIDIVTEAGRPPVVIAGTVEPGVARRGALCGPALRASAPCAPATFVMSLSKPEFHARDPAVGGFEHVAIDSDGLFVTFEISAARARVKFQLPVALCRGAFATIRRDIECLPHV
jgi:hypothetical protein